LVRDLHDILRLNRFGCSPRAHVELYQHLMLWDCSEDFKLWYDPNYPKHDIIRQAVIKVMSGIGSGGSDVHTFDQLWLELPLDRKKHQTQPANTAQKGIKRKVRPGQEGALENMFAEMGASG